MRTGEVVPKSAMDQLDGHAQMLEHQANHLGQDNLRLEKVEHKLRDEV